MAFPLAQNSPKTLRNKAFGPKYLKIRVLGALGFRDGLGRVLGFRV